MVDGIFSKKISLANKLGNRSVIEVAKARVQDFGSKSQNPIATNMGKTTKEIDWEAWDRTLELLLQTENCHAKPRIMSMPPQTR